MKPKARTWTLTANLLLEILEGNIRETTRETIISMSNPEDTPSPCQPLVNHIRENNQATAKDLVEILITIASDQKEKMP